MSQDEGGRIRGAVVVNHPADIDSLVRAARQGVIKAVARLVSLAESEDDPGLARRVSEALSQDKRRAHVIGITGSPGAGKSTLSSALVTRLRADGLRVGVLAVDPSSPLTGGAFLGDRVRMQAHATDNGVFIRSMASRGRLGGLSPAVPLAARVLEVAGYDVVLIETVGVGQSEVEIASIADTTVVVFAPGHGDAVQAAKAGIMEIADIFVVNKADMPGADDVARNLRHALLVGATQPETAWRRPIVRTSAGCDSPGGIADLMALVSRHRAWIAASGEAASRRRRRTADEIRTIVLEDVGRRLSERRSTLRLDELASRVEAAELDQYTAADIALGSLVRGGRADL